LLSFLSYPLRGPPQQCRYYSTTNTRRGQLYFSIKMPGAIAPGNGHIMPKPHNPRPAARAAEQEPGIARHIPSVTRPGPGDWFTLPKLTRANYAFFA